MARYCLCVMAAYPAVKSRKAVSLSPPRDGAAGAIKHHAEMARCSLAIKRCAAIVKRNHNEINASSLDQYDESLARSKYNSKCASAPQSRIVEKLCRSSENISTRLIFSLRGNSSICTSYLYCVKAILIKGFNAEINKYINVIGDNIGIMSPEAEIAR